MAIIFNIFIYAADIIIWMANIIIISSMRQQQRQNKIV